MWHNALTGWWKHAKIYHDQQVADPLYLKLHAVMQQHFHYHIKHATGVSTEFNQHTMTDPWYGAGQGAGDACLRWVVQGNSLILAYKSKATAWIIYSPNFEQYHKQVIDAFIDNSDLFNGLQQYQAFHDLINTTSEWVIM